MKKNNGLKLYNLIVSILAIVVMWGVWFVAWLIVDDSYVIPSVGDTVSQFLSLLVSATFWSAFGMTLLRSVWSWLISLVSAAALAALSATFKGVRSFVAPFMAVFRTVPTMAITLMLLIWSSPRIAPLIVSVLMVFPLSYSQFMAAFNGIDNGLVQMTKVYKIPFCERLFKIYIPQVLPPILSQIGANLALTLKVMISAEVLCSTFNSLGGLIYQSNVLLNTAQMFALTISALVAGGLLEWALSKLTLLTRRWEGYEGYSHSRRAQSEGGAPRCRGLGRRRVYRYGGTERSLICRRRRR